MPKGRSGGGGVVEGRQGLTSSYPQHRWQEWSYLWVILLYIVEGKDNRFVIFDQGSWLGELISFSGFLYFIYLNSKIRLVGELGFFFMKIRQFLPKFS